MGALATVSDRMHLWSPVLVKELRTRMRGARPAWLQAGYVFAMLVVMGATYAAQVGTSGRFGPSLGFQLGRALYLALFIVQAILVALIVPGLTAGTISGEQEQKTYDMLAVTRLRSRQVVVGKLFSAWLFAVLLLTTSLPLAAMCLLFGGVSPAELMWSYGIVALSALMLAAVGLWWSTAVARSLLAVVGAYATTGGLLVLSGMLVFDPVATGVGYTLAPSIFGAVNPFGAIYFASNAVAVYGWNIPTGVAGAGLLVASAALLAAAASQRLPLLGRRRGVVVRALMLLIFALFAFLAVGNYGQALRGAVTPGTMRIVCALSACLIISLLLLLVPVIGAGELESSPRRRFLSWLVGGLSPRRILQPQVRSALPFLVILALVGFGTVIGGLWFFAPKHSATWLDPLLRGAALALAAVFGCSMLGVWATLLMPGLRGRLVLGATLVIVYLLTLLVVATAPSGPRLLSVQLAYVNPAVTALSLAKPQLYASLGTLHGWAGLGVIGTSAAIYVVIGMVALAGAAVAFRRHVSPEETGDE
ncbi:MAG: ABC transporter permease [Armatimonadota bacterium]|nr:MAG: ABC transporter permease [Armatimonadota bacterium]